MLPLPPVPPPPEPPDEAPLTGLTVSGTVADLLPSAADIAVTVSDNVPETVDGAVYNPAEVIVPTVGLPPGIPATSQVTAVLVVFPTVAVNSSVPPARTDGMVGETLTVTAEAITGQLPLLADAGAEEVALFALTVTWAESVRPASSVTTTCTVIDPELGATTVANGVLAPCTAVAEEPTTLHA